MSGLDCSPDDTPWDGGESTLALNHTFKWSQYECVKWVLWCMFCLLQYQTEMWMQFYLLLLYLKIKVSIIISLVYVLNMLVWTTVHFIKPKFYAFENLSSFLCKQLVLSRSELYMFVFPSLMLLRQMIFVLVMLCENSSFWCSFHCLQKA